MVSGQNEQNVQAIAAMSSATKASTLVVLGSERAVFAAGLAALLVAVRAGVGEEVLFRGVLQMRIHFVLHG
jgi:membrane protease YdiL (CAAX protease family)